VLHIHLSSTELSSVHGLPHTLPISYLMYILPYKDSELTYIMLYMVSPWLKTILIHQRHVSFTLVVISERDLGLKDEVWRV
jgi:hypothetical protein